MECRNHKRKRIAICCLEQDRLFAEKMQKFIEKYQLPASCRKATENAELSIVCSEIRDSGDLLAEFPEYLQADHLILICSDGFSKQSLAYLNYDLRTFMERKRKADIDPCACIIPVVISGEYGGGTDDCCPTALRAMGADGPEPVQCSREKNNRSVFLHVLSRILGMDSAMLCQREKHGKRIMITAVAAVLALMIGLSLLYVKTNVEFKHHYLDYTFQYGIPVGIHRLSTAEQERTNHYVITKKNGQVISLEYVDSYGRRADHDPECWRTGNRPSACIFEYENGELSAVIYEDRFGRPYFVMEYADAGKVMLKDPYDSSLPHHLYPGFTYQPGGLLQEPYMGIGLFVPVSGFQFAYSEEGYVTGAVFLTDDSVRMASDSNVYGVFHVRDAFGRVVEEHYLDALGGVRENRWSVSAKCFAYDENDDFVEFKVLDGQGKINSDDTGHEQLHMEYDEWHNVSKLTKTNKSDPGCKATYYSRNARGLVTRADIFFEDGSYSRLRSSELFTYDESGFLTEVTALDQNGALAEVKGQDYTSIRYVRDAKGNILEESYHDSLGNPVYNSGGHVRIRYTYNAFGQETSRAYWNTDGTKPVTVNEGYSSVVITYDDRCRIISESYFDTAGNPAALQIGTTAGLHIITKQYEDGNPQKIITNYRDTEGKLFDPGGGYILDLNPYASMVQIYENGILVFWQEAQADGSIIRTIQQEFSVNEHGEQVCVLTETDFNGTVRSIQTATYRPNGITASNVIDIYDSEGKRTNTNIETYYESGLLYTKKIKTYYADEGLSMRMETVFDESGKVKEYTTQWYDWDGNPIENPPIIYGTPA